MPEESKATKADANYCAVTRSQSGGTEDEPTSATEENNETNGTAETTDHTTMETQNDETLMEKSGTFLYLSNATSIQ